MLKSRWDTALKTKGTRIKSFPCFAEIVFLYQSGAYLLSAMELRALTQTDKRYPNER